MTGTRIPGGLTRWYSTVLSRTVRPRILFKEKDLYRVKRKGDFAMQSGLLYRIYFLVFAYSRKTRAGFVQADKIIHDRAAVLIGALAQKACVPKDI